MVVFFITYFIVMFGFTVWSLISMFLFDARSTVTNLSHNPRNPWRKWDLIEQDDGSEKMINRKTGASTIVPTVYSTRNVCLFVAKRDTE